MRFLASIAVVALPASSMMAVAPTFVASQDNGGDSAVLEIRVYTLKSGTREHFHQLFVRESLPMLQRQRVDVVAYGPSLHDAASYFLVRSFASLDDRTRSEEVF
jgi:ketosteroid isomerase-like protein